MSILKDIVKCFDNNKKDSLFLIMDIKSVFYKVIEKQLDEYGNIIYKDGDSKRKIIDSIGDAYFNAKYNRKFNIFIFNIENIEDEILDYTDWKIWDQETKK